MKKVDLHCHSTVSDGLLSPADLVRRAAAKGVGLLALTDHDDVSGLAEARAAADECGMGFLNGVEVSVTWNEHTIHIVGMRIDPGRPELAEGLAAIRRGRAERALRIAQALGEAGFAGALEGAARQAGNAAIIGRTHFARYLVEQGVARDVKTVFQHYLVRGKPGYVRHQWASLEEALGWIHAAGGVAVIAHPARYRVGRNELRALVTEFKERGGEAVEVACGGHSAEQVREFGNLARHFGLLASSASDFHGPGESYADLGAVPDLPEGLVPVWRDLV